MNCIAERCSDMVSYGERASWMLDSDVGKRVSDLYWDGRSNECECYPARKSWKDVPDDIRTVGGLLDLGWTWNDIKEMVSSLCHRMDEERLYDMVRPLRPSDWHKKNCNCCAEWQLQNYKATSILREYRTIALHVFAAMRSMNLPLRRFVIDVGGLSISDDRNCGTIKVISEWGRFNF